jgi:hypothetical protein
VFDPSKELKNGWKKSKTNSKEVHGSTSHCRSGGEMLSDDAKKLL